MTSRQDEQQQRRKLVGSTTTLTYHQLANRDLALENEGRFTERATVIGQTPAPQYPAASGPWSDPVRVPDEPLLGIEINAQEPVGEAVEVAASATPSEIGGGDGAAPALLEDVLSRLIRTKQGVDVRDLGDGDRIKRRKGL